MSLGARIGAHIGSQSKHTCKCPWCGKRYEFKSMKPCYEHKCPKCHCKLVPVRGR